MPDDLRHSSDNGSEVGADRGAPPPTEESDAITRGGVDRSLRLRMKVWTDPGTGKRYLMAAAFMRDVVDGRPITDAMYAYAMTDDDTKVVSLTLSAWNALPFFYFREDGPAPRAARPADAIQ